MDLHCDGLFLEYLRVPVPVSSHRRPTFLSHSSTTYDMESEHIKAIPLSHMVVPTIIKLENTFGETCSEYTVTSKLYVVGSKSFRPDQLFKVTEIKQLCYFST